MNHSLLPSKARATLPVKYEAAKLALSECNRIDECKDWADKASALASYAKQADDKEMEKTAMRIRARAVRRCGELLGEIEKAQGRRTDLNPDKPCRCGAHMWEVIGKARRCRGCGLELEAAVGPKSETRKSVAEQAGLSERKAKTAIRVANVNGHSFEEQVESETPPTITSLADQGKKNGVPHYVQLGMTKKAFQAGMYFRSHLADLAARTKEFDPQDVVDGSTQEERNAIRRNIETIDKYLDKLMAKL